MFDPEKVIRLVDAIYPTATATYFLRYEGPHGRSGLDSPYSEKVHEFSISTYHGYDRNASDGKDEYHQRISESEILPCCADLEVIVAKDLVRSLQDIIIARWRMEEGKCQLATTPSTSQKSDLS